MDRPTRYINLETCIENLPRNRLQAVLYLDPRKIPCTCTHGQVLVLMAKHSDSYKNTRTQGKVLELMAKYSHSWKNSHTHGKVLIYNTGYWGIKVKLKSFNEICANLSRIDLF